MRNLSQKKRLTFTAGIIAIFLHFGGTDASVDVQLVVAERVTATFDGTGARTRPSPLSAGDGTSRPFSPAAPDTLTRLEIANAFHQRRSVAVG